MKSMNPIRISSRMAICGILLLAALFSVRAFAAAPAVSQSQLPAPRNSDALLIGPGDLLDLTVYNVPELTLRVRVDENGNVRLPLIGNTHLSGDTVRDAEEQIAHELIQQGMVKDPQVSLLVAEFATQGITVTGEVNMPGIYPLMGPHRLYDAISAAGGLTVKAGRTISIIHRDDPDQPEIVRLPSSDSIPKVNVMVQPGDTVVVTKAGVVYVVGEVNHPGAFLMENNTSVSILKAIALAQGTTTIASLKHACIIRKGPTGMERIPVPLDRLYHRKAHDSLLRPEDILFVPTSNPKLYGRMGLQAALTAMGTAAVYATR